MKKILFFVFALMSLSASYSQQVSQIQTGDTSLAYLGIWTLNPLYQIKDSTSAITDSYFKVLTKTLWVRPLNYQFVTTGAPVNFLWADDSGRLKKSLLSIGTGLTYNTSTGVLSNSSPNQTISISSGTGISVTGTYPSFTVTNTAPVNSLSFNAAPARAISTAGTDNTYTISTTRNCEVTYTFNFSAAITLTTSSGRVELDYSTNGGSTWTAVASVSQAFSLSITISTNQDMVLHGIIPANALVRLYRTANSNVTITTGSQQEVLL